MLVVVVVGNKDSLTLLIYRTYFTFTFISSSTRKILLNKGGKKYDFQKDGGGGIITFYIKCRIGNPYVQDNQAFFRVLLLGSA